MIRLAIGAFIVSLVMFYMAQKEWTLAAGASDQPEEMTLAALIQRGPEGNPHVTISDFDSAGEFVYAQKRGTWTKVWIPIAPLIKLELPPEGKLPKLPAKPTAVQALIYSTRVNNEKEADKVALQEKIQGMVINLIESLGYKEKELLQQSYPGTDFNRCIIFELDRKPGGSTAIIYVGIAVAAIVVGVVVLFVRFRSSSG